MAQTRSTAQDPGEIRLSGFVLAGGRSRRMGQDKAALPWHNGSLLDHMVHTLSSVAAPVRVIGRAPLPDVVPDRGPLGGILTALQITDSEKNLIVAVDLPLLTPAFMKMFRARVVASQNHILACKIGSDYPLCLGIDRTLLQEVARRTKAGQLAIREFVRDVDPEVLTEDELHLHGFNRSLFANINTPKDWARLQSES